MPTLLALINTLQAAQDAAADGGKAAIAARDEAQGSLIALLKALGNYVNYTAQGNVPVLATSGFDLVKTKQPVVLQAITQLLVTSVANTLYRCGLLAAAALKALRTSTLQTLLWPITAG
jgi:hypothetical protein